MLVPTISTAIAKAVPTNRDDQRPAGALMSAGAHSSAAMIASTSTSTSRSELASAVICRKVVAGRISENSAACSFATASKSARSVRYTRVRTTSPTSAPAVRRASARRLKISAACLPASAPPTGPSGPEAEVPEIDTNGPTLTAREYPTRGSHLEPDEKMVRLCVMVQILPARIRQVQLEFYRGNH